MTDHGKSEKRQNVRAVLTIRATIRPLNRKETEKVRALAKGSPKGAGRKSTTECRTHGSGAVSPSISGFSNFIAMLEENANPSISYFAEYLCRMDEKLDKIIDALENRPGDGDINVEDTKDISASGLGLVTQASFEKGRVLDILLYIPGFPQGKLKTYGEVVYSSPRGDSDNGYFDVGIKFLTLSVTEQEGLVAYTFCRHRKEIRQLREAGE